LPPGVCDIETSNEIADPNRRAILVLLASEKLTLNGVADHFIDRSGKRSSMH
jgi:hypothetical protein